MISLGGELVTKKKVYTYNCRPCATKLRIEMTWPAKWLSNVGDGLS